MSQIEAELIDQEEDTQRGKFLTFALGKEVYGIEIMYVTEIIGIQPITQVPEVPEFIKGIINLRGKIIPVVDLRLKFRKEAMAYDDRTCIIVVDILGSSVGLIVDNVAEVVQIPDEGIELPPDMRTGFQNRYIKGIGKVNDEIKLLLDCEKLMTQEETEILESIN